MDDLSVQRAANALSDALDLDIIPAVGLYAAVHLPADDRFRPARAAADLFDPVLPVAPPAEVPPVIAVGIERAEPDEKPFRPAGFPRPQRDLLIASGDLHIGTRQRGLRVGRLSVCPVTDLPLAV